MTNSLKVAVIGANGIGKQHARWFDGEGCEVVAFAGSSPASVERTAGVLRDLFGFSGRGYHDCEEMLRREGPDIVVVSSPPTLHAAHATAAIESGAHVLCEKPFVWREDNDGAKIDREAAALVAKAREKSRLLALNTQYVAGIDLYEQLVPECARHRTEIKCVYSEMESKGGGGKDEYEQIFIDLAPHGISLGLGWAPDAQLVPDSQTCNIQRKQTTAAFSLADGEREIRVELCVRNIEEGAPIRRFGVNGVLVDYFGRNDKNGVFRTFLSRQGREAMFDDLMQTSIRRMIQAVRGEGAVLVDAETALRNVEIQTALMHAAGERP